MDNNKLRDKARELGYEVYEDSDGTFKVIGFGLVTYYAEDNDEAWESLVEGHEVRKDVFEGQRV